MRIYNKEEAKELHPLKKGNHNWLYKALLLLEVGQAIGIDQKEWKTSNTPYATIRRVAEKLGREFDYGRHPDGSGWLVKRLK